MFCSSGEERNYSIWVSRHQSKKFLSSPMGVRGSDWGSLALPAHLHFCMHANGGTAVSLTELCSCSISLWRSLQHFLPLAAFRFIRDRAPAKACSDFVLFYSIITDHDLGFFFIQSLLGGKPLSMFHLQTPLLLEDLFKHVKQILL